MSNNSTIAAKLRKLLGHELANKIEFQTDTHLSDLMKVDAVVDMSQIRVTGKPLFTNEELSKMSKAVLHMDFEGDELSQTISDPMLVLRNPQLTRTAITH